MDVLLNWRRAPNLHSYQLTHNCQRRDRDRVLGLASKAQKHMDESYHQYEKGYFALTYKRCSPRLKHLLRAGWYDKLVSSDFPDFQKPEEGAMVGGITTRAGFFAAKATGVGPSTSVKSQAKITQDTSSNTRAFHRSGLRCEVVIVQSRRRSRERVGPALPTPESMKINRDVEPRDSAVKSNMGTGSPKRKAANADVLSQEHIPKRIRKTNDGVGGASAVARALNTAAHSNGMTTPPISEAHTDLLPQLNSHVELAHPNVRAPDTTQAEDNIPLAGGLFTNTSSMTIHSVTNSGIAVVKSNAEARTQPSVCVYELIQGVLSRLEAIEGRLTQGAGGQNVPASQLTPAREGMPTQEPIPVLTASSNAIPQSPGVPNWNPPSQGFNILSAPLLPKIDAPTSSHFVVNCLGPPSTSSPHPAMTPAFPHGSIGGFPSPFQPGIGQNNNGHYNLTGGNQASRTGYHGKPTVRRGNLADNQHHTREKVEVKLRSECA